MYLKKLKLSGFKSFADATVLEFHPGITAIVGPNGCGKSNISDAFRWVLGEQSAKSMRGAKMHDVIFAGTSKRKPLNLGEVCITFGEVGERLKTDYDEVSVTRRIHRSGESDYLLNRNSVRLKDVYDLFLDSGIGKDAFSIFEQGKLDQVINLTPLDRRYIFEEAAGILRFLQRKKEALGRLEQTEQNIERVKDIHKEVEKHITVLQLQAEKARCYKDDKSALEVLELSLAAARFAQFAKRSETLNLKEREKNESHERALHELHTLDLERQNSFIRLNHATREWQARKEEVFKTRSQKEIQTREREGQEERLREMGLKEEKWKKELLERVEKRKQRQIEAEYAQVKQHEVEQELSGLDQGRESQRESLRLLEHSVAETRDRQHAGHQELMRLLQTGNRIESDQKQASLRLEHANERKNRLLETQRSGEEHLAALAQSLDAKKREISSAAAYQQKQKEELAHFHAHIEKQSTQIKTCQERINKSLQEKAEVKARQNALLRLKEEMEGFSKGTRKLLQEAQNSKSLLFQKVKGLYEALNVEGEGNVALSVVLKPYSQTLVVETLADFKEIVAHAKKNGWSDFSLLCLEGLPSPMPSKEPDALLAKFGDHFLTSHFLKEVMVRDTAEESMSVGQEAWIEEGIYVDRHRVVFYPAKGEGNVFLREAELNTLDKKISVLELERLELEQDLKILLQERNELQTEKTAFEQTMRQAEFKLVEERYALERFEAEKVKLLRDVERSQEEIDLLEESSAGLKQTMLELQSRHAEHKAQAEEAQRRVQAYNQELQERVETLKIEQQEMEVKESAYQKIADEKRKLGHLLNLFEVKDLESLQQEKRLEEEIALIQEKRSEIRLNRVDYDQKLEEIERSLQEIVEQCAQLESNAAAIKEEIQKVEEGLNLKREAIKQQEKEQHELGIQRAQLESADEALRAECLERYRLTLEEIQAQAQPLEESLDKAERQVRTLRRKIEEAGDINMTSIEEFDKHKERYEFLNKQLEDLASSKAELVAIITQLDEESRKIFKETFEIIRQNFKKNFDILFRGGESDLMFTESGDILEAGIEIVAKPPGKAMRSINLMSGGEKCLTAVALLFAIFEVKPAPFCILDEIDAPLDDSNVERFLNVVKQFTDRCQFIIITHNKRTMAIADRLYGVSMQEKGVSKILQMEFAKEEGESAEVVLV